MRVIFHPEFPKDIRTFEADYTRRHDPCLAFALVRVIRGQNPSLSGLWRQKKFGRTPNSLRRATRRGDTRAALISNSPDQCGRNFGGSPELEGERFARPPNQ